MKFLLSLYVTCMTFVSFVKAQGSSGQIVGRAMAGSVPYQVSFRDDQTNKHVCSGTIINQRWILTAAQCFDAILADSRYIKVGSNQLNGGTRYDILSALVHPLFDFANNDFDYALVQTTDNIAFNKNVKPVALATETPKSGSTGTFTGWRVTNSAAKSPANKLQSIQLKVITNDRCAKLLPNLGVNQLCTLSTVAGACAGDTGGPLLANGKLVGVTSSKLPCVRDKPNLFADTAKVSQWIEDNTPL